MTKLTNSELKEIKELIDRAKNILIVSHFNPDGDSIGASLALMHFFAGIGKKSEILIPNTFPDFLSFLPGTEKIIVYEFHPAKARKIIKTADLIFCLDFNALSRVKDFEPDLRKAVAPRILIDHHPNPENSFKHKISRINVSSTSELVYELIQGLEEESRIDKDTATCIFTGIMTDTGSFSYSCNYPSTFRIVALLLEKGIDAELIHQRVYDTFSEDRLRLLGYCLSEKLVVLKEFRTAYIALSNHELQSFNFKPGDTEGIVNYALSIEGIIFAILFSEKDHMIRISFRSKGDFRVNDFAHKHYGGGGHKNAAGADSFKPLDETLNDFISKLHEYREQLHFIADSLPNQMR